MPQPIANFIYRDVDEDAEFQNFLNSRAVDKDALAAEIDSILATRDVDDQWTRLTENL